MGGFVSVEVNSLVAVAGDQDRRMQELELRCEREGRGAKFRERRTKFRSQSVNKQYAIHGGVKFKDPEYRSAWVIEQLEQEFTPLPRLAEDDDAFWSTLQSAVKDEKADYQIEVSWAKAHVYLPLAELDAAKIPSKGAVALLRVFRADRKAMLDAVIKAGTKELAERDARFTDDGRGILGTIDKLLKETDGEATDRQAVITLVMVIAFFFCLFLSILCAGG